MKTNIKRTYHVIFVAVILAISMVSSAWAEDGKVYNGALCVEVSDSDPELVYDGNGGAYNNSTWGNWVICPVVRDHIASNMDINDWDVTVNRRGSASVWDIRLYSMNVTGTSGWSNSITVPGGNGYKNLDGNPIRSSYAHGMVFIKTYLPASAMIRRYEITEN